MAITALSSPDRASASVGSVYEVEQTVLTNATQDVVVVYATDDLSDFDEQARESVLRGLKQAANKYRGSFAEFAE